MKLGRAGASDDEERVNGKPYFIFLHPQRRHKDCAVLSNRKIPGERKETNFFCKTCERNRGITCPGNCFERYHIVRNYKIQETGQM